jgi:hypothetical protein
MLARPSGLEWRPRARSAQLGVVELYGELPVAGAQHAADSAVPDSDSDPFPGRHIRVAGGEAKRPFAAGELGECAGRGMGSAGFE